MPFVLLHEMEERRKYGGEVAWRLGNFINLAIQDDWWPGVQIEIHIIGACLPEPTFNILEEALHEKLWVLTQRVNIPAWTVLTVCSHRDVGPAKVVSRDFRVDEPHLVSRAV